MTLYSDRFTLMGKESMDDFCTQSNLNSMAFKRPQDQPRRPFIDTFSFIPCRRVDSDASSFYFRPLLPVDMVAESPVSLPKLPDKQVQSQFWVPPLKRLQFCCHIIREAWCHQKDASLDSVMSDFSAMYLGRPGIGDKMFDHAVDLGPLTSISASPPNASWTMNRGRP
jgi:serine/arginine repetitive matrix protein 2